MRTGRARNATKAATPATVPSAGTSRHDRRDAAKTPNTARKTATTARPTGSRTPAILADRDDQRREVGEVQREGEDVVERHDQARGSQGRQGLDPQALVGLDEALPLDDGREALHELGIELAAGVGRELRDDAVERPSQPIRPVVDHRVERIDEADDARPDRDLLALQPIRIARPVPAFVVVPDDRRELA